MGRTRELILVFAATVLLASAVSGALMSMRVSASLIAVIAMLIAGTGSHLLSRIVMRYGPPEQRG
jgi:multisubunit Na+/H+ antiporter MnhG subunit